MARCMWFDEEPSEPPFNEDLEAHLSRPGDRLSDSVLFALGLPPRHRSTEPAKSIQD